MKTDAMQPSKRRILRRTLRLIGLILPALIVAALFFMSTSPFESYLLEQIDRNLSRRAGVSLKADKLSFNPWRLTLSLDHPQVRPVIPGDLPLEMFSAERIDVDLPLTALLTRKLHVQKLLVIRPSLAGRLDRPAPAVEESPSTLPAAQETAGPDAQTLDFRIDDLRLEQGAVTLADGRHDLQASLKNLAASLQYQAQGGIHVGALSFRESALQLGSDQWEIQQALVEVEVESEAVIVRRLRLDSDLMQLEASGRIDDLPLRPRFDFRFRSSPNWAGLSALFPAGLETRGTMEMTGVITGNIGSLNVTGEIDGRDLTVSDFTIPVMKMAFTASPSELQIEAVKLETPEGGLVGRGTFSLLKDKDSQLRLAWSGIRLQPLAEAFRPGTVLPSSRLEGELEISGRVQDPASLTGKARVRLIPLAFSSSTPAFPLQGEIELRLEGETLRILPSEMSLPGARLRLNGSLDLKQNIRAALSLESPDLEPFIQALSPYLSEFAPHDPTGLTASRWTGRLELSAAIDGTWPESRVTLKLNGSEIGTDRFAIGTLELEAERNRDGIRIDRFVLESDLADIVGRGVLPERRGARMGLPGQPLALTISKLDLGRLAAFSPRPLDAEGEITGQVQVLGTASDPSFELQLSLPTAEIMGVSLQSGELQGGGDRRFWKIEQLALRMGEGRLDGSLSLDTVSGAYETKLEASSIDPADFRALLPSAPLLSGNLGLSMGGQGRLDRPAFDLHLIWEQARWESLSLSRVDLVAQADGERLKARLTLPEGRTEVTLEGELANPKTLSGGFRTSRLDPFSLWIAPAQTGDLAGEVTLSGDFLLALDDPRQSTLVIQGERLGLTYKTLNLMNERPFKIGLEEEELTVRDLTFSGTDMKIGLNGNLHLAGNGKDGLQAEAHLNLALLEPFLPGSSLPGTLDIRGDISGSLEDPMMSGLIKLKAEAWSLPPLPIDIRGLSLAAELRANRLILSDLTFGLGRGSLNAQGEISLANFFPRSQQEAKISPAAPNHLVLTIRDLHPADFFTALPDNLREELDGDLDGVFRFGGDFGSLAGLEMEGELSRLILAFPPLQLQNQGAVRVGLRDGVLQVPEFNIQGKTSSFQGAGRINLITRSDMDLRFDALMDAAELTPFLEDVVVKGLISMNLAARGNLDQPQVEGQARLEQGLVQLPEYNLLASNLRGDVKLTPKGVRLESLEGDLNGGSVKAQGDFEFAGPEGRTGRFRLDAERVQVTFPEGLQAEAKGGLILATKADQWVLSGDIQVARAYYSQDIYPGRELWSAIRYRRLRSLSDIPPPMRVLNLDLNLGLPDPLLIENNLADIELDGNVQIKGTPVVPLLSGYLASSRIGEVEVGGRTYQLERLNLEFPGKDIQESVLDLAAHTNLSHDNQDLQITLTLSGPLNRLNYSLSSNAVPAISQTELASLLITGYGTQRLKNEAANVIGNQMILYFTSPLASPLTNRIREFLKAESVSLEPINVASQEDPGARFTFRKGLVKNTDLVYSIDIGNTQQQTWILDYSFSRNFNVQGFQRDNGTYGASLSHRFFPRNLLFWQKKPPQPERKRSQIREIRFMGEKIFETSVLAAKASRVKVGKPFDYRRLREAVERLEAFYKTSGYVDVVVEPKVSTDKELSDVIFDIDAGDPAEIVFAGSSLSARLKNEIIKSWNGRIPGVIRTQTAASQLLKRLQSMGYFEAQVDTVREQRPEGLIYTFAIQKGQRYRPRRLILIDESVVTAEMIKKNLSAIPRRIGHPYWTLLTDYRRARRRILDLYEERGHLYARIRRPVFTADPTERRVDILLEIQPGPQTRVRSVKLSEGLSFAETDLRQNLQLTAGSIFRPSILAEDNNRLLNFYRERGYQDITANVVVNPISNTEVDLAYSIEEGIRHVIRSIEISGNHKTPDNFIRRELEMSEGDPVNMEKLVMSQKKLYDLDIFRIVNIQRDPETRADGREDIKIEVRETPSLAFRYGFRYNSEEKLEGFGQLDLVNLYGRGRNALIFYRQNKLYKDFRFSLSDPYLFGKRFNTLHSFYYQEMVASVFRSDELGYSIQQEHKLPWELSLSYLYRYSRIHTYELEPSGPFPYDFTYNLSELQTYVVRDTRSDRLNAGRGSFLSLSLTLSPEFLRSEQPYISFFGQFSLFQPLRKGFLWASNYRIGLADAYDEILIPSRRFFAGGANSIRGFEREWVGPLDPLMQVPTGGEALFVMNQELRFPLYKWISGVTFYDMGNAYDTLGDFNPLEIRHGIGLGLRLNTPAALIRLDYGINLFPRMNEPRGVLYFSIGQAF